MPNLSKISWTVSNVDFRAFRTAEVHNKSTRRFSHGTYYVGDLKIWMMLFVVWSKPNCIVQV